MKLDERVAIVTGGSSGIGRGIALAFADHGAHVVVADISEAPRRGKYHEKEVSTTTVEEIESVGCEGLFVNADVSRDADLHAIIDQTLEQFGGIDILVNNAGIYIPGGSEEISIQDYKRMIAVNFRAVFVLTRLAIPHLKQSAFGRIIHIASVHAYGGGAGPAYAPAKAGLVNMSRDTALEVGRHGITVNAICPGYIETALQDYLQPEQIQACRDRTPLPRLGKPSDIGAACVFLASDDAEWITGISLVVDGGYTASV